MVILSKKRSKTQNILSPSICPLVRHGAIFELLFLTVASKTVKKQLHLLSAPFAADLAFIAFCLVFAIILFKSQLCVHLNVSRVHLAMFLSINFSTALEISSFIFSSIFVVYLLFLNLLTTRKAVFGQQILIYSCSILFLLMIRSKN